MAKIEEEKICKIAKGLEISPDEFITEAIDTFLKKELRKVQAEIFRLCGKYEVTKSSEIDEKYQKGKLEEDDSWEDYFKLDHLEYRRKNILNSLEILSDHR